jgi:hypothetical protein
MTSAGRVQKRWLAVALMMALCMGCCGLAVVSARLSPATTRSVLDGTRLCMGTSTTPYFQIGLGWELPQRTLILSSLGPPLLYSPTAVCAYLPWEIPFIPIRGALVLPP